MVKEVTGYKFNVEAAAKNAQNSLRVHYLGGRPAGDYVTTEWVNVEHNTGASGDFYYFLGDYSPVLGNPTMFNIDTEDDII